MNVTLQQTEKLLKGIQKFKLYAFSMMLTHLKDLYSKDPTQPMLASCAEEINKFINKYQAIMAEDYKIIESL